MVLRIQKKAENRIFKVYMLAMFSLFIARYLFEFNVPAIVFLAVAMIPVWFGSISEQMAFVVSCIPFSIAFQYKYAILILVVAILIKKHWRFKRYGVFILVMIMMVWELCHAFYEPFSYVEYLRGFAELILLGIVTSIDIEDVDYRLVVRSLTVSVVGVCIIMLIMLFQQYGFNIVNVFMRSLQMFRFGQGNMKSGAFALNFNANNLGFICNLSACGGMMLAARKEHSCGDIVMVILSIAFAMMTLSRAAFVCSITIFVTFLFSTEGKRMEKIFSGIGGIAVAIAAVALIWVLVPSVFENILERFQRADVWNGRGALLKYYGEFIMSSWKYFVFGIGMQNIYEKVSPHFPVHDVPHMGLQEVWVAWGVVGVVIFLIVICKIVATSKRYADGKRQFYQFMPLGMTLLFTMSGQLLTSSRTLIALTFAYICLCVKNNNCRMENTINSEKKYE